MNYNDNEPVDSLLDIIKLFSDLINSINPSIKSFLTNWLPKNFFPRVPTRSFSLLSTSPSTQQMNATAIGKNFFSAWLHQYVPDNCVIHSFRHSFRDRLRAVECLSDIVDAIGGWKTSGVGHGYGNGYPLEVLEKWRNKIEC